MSVQPTLPKGVQYFLSAMNAMGIDELCAFLSERFKAPEIAQAMEEAMPALKLIAWNASKLGIDVTRGEFTDHPRAGELLEMMDKEFALVGQKLAPHYARMVEITETLRKETIAKHKATRARAVESMRTLAAEKARAESLLRNNKSGQESSKELAEMLAAADSAQEELRRILRELDIVLESLGAGDFH